MHTPTSSVNVVTLAKKNLLANYTYLSSFNPQIRIAPVLKSNAYGHGLVAIAKLLDAYKLPFLCVNSFHEAQILYENGIKTKILIMGYVDPLDLQKGNFPFAYTTYTYKQLEAINTYQQHASVHIFVDTGMHREGFRVEKLKQLITNLKGLQNIHIDGIMSHFASGDKPEDPRTRYQIENFLKAKKLLGKLGVNPRWEHICASTGLLSMAKKHRFGLGNVARVGKALYGIEPSSDDPHLSPVLKLTTKLVQVKKLKQGDTVGYDGTYTVEKNMMLGVLPIGYYDGIDRRLSNKGAVLVHDILCPIVGRVSMNITTIDITSLPNPKVGYEVTVFSDDPNDANSVETVAKLCETIPYDIVVGLAPTLFRKVV